MYKYFRCGQTRKRYERHAWVGRKRDAESIAKKLRKQGYNARITSYKDSSEGKIYEVWKRKGR